MEAERFFHGNLWIRDNARDSKSVSGCGVNHQGMQEVDIPDFAGCFDEVGAACPDEVVIEIQAFGFGKWGLASGRHPG